MQKEFQPQYPLLYSLQGYQYCDLLLGQGKYKEVRERGRKTLSWATEHLGLLEIALDHLSLGRACILEGESGFAEAQVQLDQAVAGLRQAGTQHELPRGLLARAALYRLRGDFAHAQRDLDEALLIATRGSMRLHEADCHLEQARLSLAAGDLARARAIASRARAIIQETGYHRRDHELAELEERLRKAESQASSSGSEGA